ncbi:MAG: dihydrodipicolinate synthase family protein [Thermoproteus sp.]|jgi:4-hydroxy-tetrahydrodipicolinate synthase|uniref:dihydrodipicolinate synthase family protein n=1 Tax=Thermoproteus sp. CP80 TaxID=1650659 RepID=UPI00074A6E09|nr:dihydrodipicolinate synthase family protein [Thermoproteus sp. CP80]KUO87104.1 MAG: dihydrodipicolinate synthase family protein [Thermoproteus sp. JCHS_4]MDT7870499.1 dihydrodipicolinate synthase family protein [Thermoproteus sp.]MDT7882905.1 dihydrodipicolinate synthase family protein [Thermoproteus sp.]PLC64728.1 dihydrodipicolinate synthase family protein [Thermoproteus sp. CP80]
MRLEGVIAATVTPFRKDGVNYEALRDLLARLASQGYGLFPSSSTGEVAKLTPEERVKVAELAVEVGGGKVPVIAGTGTGDHISTIEMARRYKDVGVDAVLITPPYYVQGDWAGIYAFYKKVLDAVDMPAVLYTIPLAVGYNIPAEVFDLVSSEYSQVAAVKDSSGDFRYHMELIYLVGGRISVLQGVDMFFVPSLIVGAHGGILGGPNFLGPLQLRLYNMVREGRIAEAVEIHRKLMELWRFMGGCGLTGKLGGKWPTLYKIATQMATGIDMGPPREPLPPVDDRDREELRKILEKLAPLTR